MKKNGKTAGIVYFTFQGKKTADKVKKILEDEGYTVNVRDKNQPLAQWTGCVFDRFQFIIFICATGIAVRTIAPFIKSKKEDPGVIVIDDRGKFVISLLSGHIGGANSMCSLLSRGISATPVITTATDGRGKPAIDSWAHENNLIIENMDMAKKCAMLFLEDRVIPVISDMPLVIERPELRKIGQPEVSCKTEETDTFGIHITWKDGSVFSEELKLIPKRLVLGIGCRRHTEKSVIEKAVSEILGENHISREALFRVSSIDLKKDEKGLLEFAEENNLEFTTYTAEELAKVQGDFPESDFVAGVTGVSNVCQRAAVSGSGNGKVLIEKTVRHSVTVSVAIKEDVLYVK